MNRLTNHEMPPASTSIIATEDRTCTDLWDSFLARWPLQSLPAMTLEQYAQAGNKDSFVYWLESRTEDLGSIWGGSSFKFGVYSRKDRSEKAASGGAQYNQTHAWLSKYGGSAQEAFERVRAIIVAVAQAARAGDLDAIEAADMGDTTKWKIAFLYQDREHPCVLNIFSRAALQVLPGVDAKGNCAQMHHTLMGAKAADESLLVYGRRLWGEAEKLLHAGVKNDDALQYLQHYPGLTPIKPPTEKHAGFRCRDGREMCLMRSRKTPVIYVQPGEWFDSITKSRYRYTLKGPTDTRSHGLSANASSLAAPSAALAITVQSWEDLMALCEAYTGEAPPPTPAAGAKPTTPNTAPDIASAAERPPLNRILYGPPGTGKTYATVDAALTIVDPAFLALHQVDRAALKRRFDELSQEGRIRFVTFHQSFSYEDFVEGLRAVTDDVSGQLRYEIVDGVFKTLCQTAAVQVTQQYAAEEQGLFEIAGRRIWKMSLGNTLGSDSGIYDECIANGCALLGWGGSIDFSGCKSRADVQQRFADAGVALVNPQTDYGVTSVVAFVTRMKVGDLLIISDGNFKFRAIGEVSGDYAFKPHPEYEDDYSQMRPVKWLRQYRPALPHTELMNNQFSQMTLYELRSGSIDIAKLQALLSGTARRSEHGTGLMLDAWPDSDQNRSHAPQVAGHLASGARVLIIDEINRGNVSRIFGELITLIEPSKRTGAADALEAVLPYSKTRFGVPRNVHLIGTMNTADRSLTGIDIALRRRFVFTEMSPQPDLLQGLVVEGIDIAALLEVMNQRIEALLDRDHRLGHAYFMPLRQEPTLDKLAEIFGSQVLPLLQEYFFDDWQRIRWVLNDHRKPDEDFRFVTARELDSVDLFGETVNVNRRAQLWQVNADAFGCVQSYLGVMNHLDAVE